MKHDAETEDCENMLTQPRRIVSEDFVHKLMVAKAPSSSRVKLVDSCPARCCAVDEASVAREGQSCDASCPIESRNESVRDMAVNDNLRSSDCEESPAIKLP